MSKKMMFEVLYGPINTPMDEWEIHGTYSYDPDEPKSDSYYGSNVPPELIQETYVRRPNWDQQYRAKVNPERYPLTYQYMMRQVPAEMDYQARAEKNGWVIWTSYQRDQWSVLRLSDDKTQVTYYPTEKDARLDRSKTISTVRYLRTERGYDEDEIALICRREGIPYASEWELKFATTREEIREVYIKGPRSCMSGENDMGVYGFHPVEVYACDPIAVAYLVSKADPDHISARAVVNTQTKGWVEIYGARSQMRMLLSEQGYSSDRRCISGHKLLRICSTNESYKNTHILPYADYYYDSHILSADGKYWLVDMTEEEYQNPVPDVHPEICF